MRCRELCQTVSIPLSSASSGRRLPWGRRLVGAALLLLGLAGRLTPQSAAGDPDPTFGSGGQLLVDFQSSTDIAFALARQPDARLVVAGTSYVNNDFTGEDFALTRLMVNGTVDLSFGVGGRVRTDFPGLAAVVSSVVVQPDGKLVVAGGAFPELAFLGDFELVRYNADGSLDTSFGTGGIVTTSFPGQGSFAHALALQPDGKLVAAGTDFVNFSGDESSNTDFALARYNPDGTPDASFGVGGKVVTDFAGFNDDAFSILVQPDGRLVAVGSAKNAATFYDFAAARYLANGQLDTSFGIGGKLRTDFGASGLDQALCARLQPDGKLVAAGLSIDTGGFPELFALARYDSHGVLDASFDGDGRLQIDFGSFGQAAHSVLLQPDGKLVVVGFADSESADGDFLLARCQPDGSLDAAFGNGGKVRTSFGDLNAGANAALLQPDGRILAAGFSATGTSAFAEFALARYTNDLVGWLDQQGALAGSLGEPLFVGTGDLTVGSLNSVVLTRALPAAASALFVAFSSMPVPFKGGMLQAFPFVGPLIAATNAQGSVALSFTMPAELPGGTTIVLQWAIKDAAAVQGVALSNALLGVVTSP